jgi:ankyrin repeat protein
MEEAILKNDIDTIKYLLEHGYDPNSKTEAGTPLIFISTNLEILKLLLDYGADSQCPDEYGFILQEYCDNSETLSLLNKPRNVILVAETKTIKYNETLRLRKKRAKTLRAKKQTKAPAQSD